MFSQYGQRLFKHSKDHQIFAISLPNLQEICLKTHPDTRKNVNYDEVVKIALNQEKNYTLTGNYKFTGNLIVAAVPKKGSVLNSVKSIAKYPGEQWPGCGINLFMIISRLISTPFGKQQQKKSLS
jgi:hypothetical protein